MHPDFNLRKRILKNETEFQINKTQKPDFLKPIKVQFFVNLSKTFQVRIILTSFGNCS